MLDFKDPDPGSKGVRGVAEGGRSAAYNIALVPNISSKATSRSIA